jgi:hypothetical protein
MKKRNYWTGVGMVKSVKRATIFDKKKETSYEVTDIMLSIKQIIKGKDKYTIVPLEAWGDMSKACVDLTEGDLIEVEGHFANKKWKDGSDVERKLNLIVVESIKKS